MAEARQSKDDQASNQAPHHSQQHPHHHHEHRATSAQTQTPQDHNSNATPNTKPESLATYIQALKRELGTTPSAIMQGLKLLHQQFAHDEVRCAAEREELDLPVDAALPYATMHDEWIEACERGEKDYEDETGRALPEPPDGMRERLDVMKRVFEAMGSSG